MKKIFILLFTVLITGFFFSCHNMLEMEDDSSKEDTCIKISITTGEKSSRTVMPQSFQLEDFDYTLSARIDNSSEEKVIINKTDFDSIANEKIQLKEKKYVFTLSGYIKNTEKAAIKGVSQIIDLTKGGTQTVSFVMKPLTGLTGSAEISVSYPSDVKTVKCFVTKDLFGLQQDKSVTVTSTSSDTTHTKFTLSNVPSGTESFAVIYFYDADGKKIASRVESLYVIGGVTSTSSLEITNDNLHTYDVNITFTKDSGELDLFGSEMILVDSEGKETALTLSNGKFTGKEIGEDFYKVYIKTEAGDKIDTGVIFSSADESQTYNLKTVKVPLSDGITFTPVTPFAGGLKGDNAGEYLIPETSDGIEFTVKVSDGYVQKENEQLKVNGNVIADVDSKLDGTQIYLTSESGTVVTSGTTTVNFTIAYNLDKASWTAGYTAPSSYNVKNYSTVELPGAADIVLKGSLFDGWKDENGDTFTKIPAGKTGNLILTPVWKQGVEFVVKPDKLTEENKNLWTQEEITNNSIKGKVFASGNSLIVKWEDETNGTGKTKVYYDYNSNGVIDKDKDNEVDYANGFEGFILEAKNSDGSTPASDFLFTILGGELAGIRGTGKDSNNKSTVNISGKNTVIGNKKDVGVFLETLTDEHININGQLSGNYHITLISANKYMKGHDYFKVAYIDNASYAQMANIECLYREPAASTYESQTLNIMDSNGKKIIYLADESPIDVPTNAANGIIWIKDTNGNISKTDFTLGSTATIRVPCSVFSVSVKNGTGTFYLTQDSLKNAAGDVIVTDNLGQKSATEYDTELGTGEDYQYTYLHMFSTKDQITPSIATEFLRSIVFQKKTETQKIDISINLETIPYSDIEEFAKSQGTTVDKFKYFDGSFYLQKEFPYSGDDKPIKEGSTEYIHNYTKYYSWIEAYDEAKSTVFNGLNGYLMTITSEVENGYVFSQLKAERAWTGGSLLKPSGTYDSLTFTKNGTNDGYYWMCGPEAGQKFFSSDNKTSTGMFTNFMNEEPNNGSSEPCIQFCKNAEWNNMPEKNEYVTEQWGFTPHSYVVEFRPYTNDYTTQKANYQSVSLDQSY